MTWSDLLPGCLKRTKGFSPASRSNAFHMALPLQTPPTAPHAPHAPQPVRKLSQRKCTAQCNKPSLQHMTFNSLNVFSICFQSTKTGTKMEKAHLIASLSQCLFRSGFPVLCPEFPHVPSLHGALAGASDSQRNAPCAGDQSPGPCSSQSCHFYQKTS